MKNKKNEIHDYNKKVHFSNEPFYSKYEVDLKYNEKRKTLIPLIRDFLSRHASFAKEEITVSFLHTGISSLVCVIETNTQKLILKIPLNEIDSKLEGVFLKQWSNVGVRVPLVKEEGEISGNYYILMEFINAQTISQAYTKTELIKKKIYKKMGEMLLKMHKVKTNGYSNIVNKKTHPEYVTITKWIEGDTNLQNQIKYVQENNLLNSEESGSIQDAFNILINSLQDDSNTVYCHNDFSTGNIFATNEELTVFDPWPCYHHPFMDIARSIILISDKKIGEEAEMLLLGYFKNAHYDKKLLHAFLYINIVAKLPYMHKTERFDTIKEMKKYLKKNKDLLY